jgi:hypothetical protein
MAQTQDETLEVVFAVEGDRKPRALQLRPDATVADLIDALCKGGGAPEEVCLEDADDALEPDTELAGLLTGEFKVLHAGRRGRIKLTIVFNGREVKETFRPSATVRRVLRWAVDALGLDGDPSDFQLKLDDELLPPETHLGQIAKSRKVLELALVMKIKPQG